MKSNKGIARLIIGVLMALAGVGIMVNHISFVTIDGNPELSATLTNGGAVGLMVIGVILVISAIIPKLKK